MKNGEGIFLKELYLKGRDLLKKSGLENPELEAALLLSKVLRINTTYIYAHPKNWVQSDKIKEFELLLERRIKREPIAYILGEKEFYSRSFIVTPDVLIPRPETEILFEEALKIINNIPYPTVLDVGTGSGCIAVTIACEAGNAQNFATDISFEALMVARANSERHKVSKRISYVCADFLSCFNENSFDIILSNPPYIPEGEFYSLESNVRDFEPKISLIGGGSILRQGSGQALRLHPSTVRSELVEDSRPTTGEEGLNCIRKIVHEAGKVLKNGGWCIIEVGANQSEKVSEIFKGVGFKEVSAVKDLAGIERVVKGKWKR
ncbi:MAG: bifunctional N5-glutamine S-adenosyl-L-methionine-dependent methyltransferase/tRNA (m7G46) methyltransferase [Candidatus Dadabacteria bacterium CSP1-2]|nr:MAG: bifunctional N5-glutamine S-adenosyl-L-methionine-dependent methyltransferase/tRNA (m7G46) methyltransferase [Candidatus Dadabacteria bacterium CSP1-2]